MCHFKPRVQLISRQAYLTRKRKIASVSRERNDVGGEMERLREYVQLSWLERVIICFWRGMIAARLLKNPTAYQRGVLLAASSVLEPLISSCRVPSTCGRVATSYGRRHLVVDCV